MTETNSDWDDFRLFISVARAQGLSAAASVTGKSAPTLSRRMLALERRLGQNLFDRLNNGYELTKEGHQLFDKLVDVERIVQPLDKQADSTQPPRVKLSAGTWVTQFLCAQLGSWASSSNIPIEFIAADHVLDIAHREAVLGIRNQKPSQPSLVCQPLGHVNFAIYACNKDVQSWVQVVGNTPSALWVAQNCNTEADIKVSHSRNAMDLVKTGRFKAVLPTFIGDNTTDIQRVSGVIPELEHKQWLVMHQEDRHRPEVRETINFVKQHLGDGNTLA